MTGDAIEWSYDSDPRTVRLAARTTRWTGWITVALFGVLLLTWALRTGDVLPRTLFLVYVAITASSELRSMRALRVATASWNEIHVRVRADERGLTVLSPDGQARLRWASVARLVVRRGGGRAILAVSSVEGSGEVIDASGLTTGQLHQLIDWQRSRQLGELPDRIVPAHEVAPDDPEAIATVEASERGVPVRVQFCLDDIRVHGPIDATVDWAALNDIVEDGDHVELRFAGASAPIEVARSAFTDPDRQLAELRTAWQAARGQAVPTS